MKKLIHESFYGEGNPNNSRSMFGISEEVIWKCTDYYGGPKEDGTYTVSDGDGMPYELSFAVKGLSLFSDFIEHLQIRAIKHLDRNGELESDDFTNDELVELAKANDVWYEDVPIEKYGDWYGNTIYVYGFNQKGTRPKYFLDKNIIGPIDSDLETMEEEVRE